MEMPNSPTTSVPATMTMTTAEVLGNTRARVSTVATSFFFLAEDGIRGRDVTGVQTCALPIYLRVGRDRHRQEFVAVDGDVLRDRLRGDRSEERRVGKECRSRWTPDP